MVCRVVAGASLVGLLSSCGGSPLAPTASVDGAWVGTVESAEDGPEDGPGTMDGRLSQAGLQVTGSMRLSQDGVSNVEVTLSGMLDGPLPTTAHLTATYVYGLGCEGAFTADVRVLRDTIEGPFRGANCVHAFAGRLQMTRSVN